MTKKLPEKKCRSQGEIDPVLLVRSCNLPETRKCRRNCRRVYAGAIATGTRPSSEFRLSLCYLPDAK